VTKNTKYTAKVRKVLVEVGIDNLLVHRVHRVLEKSLKVLEFWRKNSRPLKVLENRVGP